MGFLDNSTITVDAVLTKEAKQNIANGKGLDPVYFSLGDSGVAYNCWNEAHPQGSSYFGEAIEQMPVLEAIPNGAYTSNSPLGPALPGLLKWPYIEFEDNIKTLKLTEAGEEFDFEIVPELKNYSLPAGQKAQFLFEVYGAQDIIADKSGYYLDPPKRTLQPGDDGANPVVYGPAETLTIYAQTIEKNTEVKITVVHAQSGVSADFDVSVVRNAKF